MQTQVTNSIFLLDSLKVFSVCFVNSITIPRCRDFTGFKFLNRTVVTVYTLGLCQ